MRVLSVRWHPALFPITAGCLCLALSATPLAAQDEGEEVLGWIEALEFTPLTGTVTVGRNLAEIDLPDGWSFLDGRQGRRFVEEIWGNPPDTTTLGFAYPTTPSMDLPAWGIIVSYEDDGHIDDDDAASIDFEEMMDAIKDDADEMNDARREAGYETLEIRGWAESPHYDAATKKIYWAKDILFEGSDEHTLNYEVRVLGRTGVLSMNAVAGMSDLEEVRAGSRSLLAGTRFLEGNLYSDFDPGTDKLAAYGVGGLIAGNILLKGGLFAKFGLLFAKFGKILLVAGVALIAFIGRLFGRKKN